jgi:hypothetical protein
MEPGSRIATARRQLRVARLSIGAVAAAGFALFVFAARAAHPGTSSAATSTQAASAASEDDSRTGTFDFGQASIGPSGGGGASVGSGGS